MSDRDGEKSEEPLPYLEEMLAEGPRQKFVNEMFGGAVEQEMQEREQAIKERDAAEERSHIDPLTQLYNRRGLNMESERLFSHFAPGGEKRRERRLSHIMVLIVDIDHFKNVNDTYGHAAGDIVLQKVAEALKTKLRGVNLICRWGGEEFVIVFPHTTQQQLEKILEDRFGSDESSEEKLPRIELRIPEVKTENGKPLLVTLSGGYVAVDEKHKTIDQVVEEADAALYVAKETGRNKIIPYHPDMANAKAKAKGAVA